MLDNKGKMDCVLSTLSTLLLENEALGSAVLCINLLLFFSCNLERLGCVYSPLLQNVGDSFSNFMVQCLELGSCPHVPLLFLSTLICDCLLKLPIG